MSFQMIPKAPTATLFADLSDRVQDWRKDNEEGLMGFAFHPNYKTVTDISMSTTVRRLNLACRSFPDSKCQQTDPNRADVWQ
jgi:hypothetical protein